LKPCARPSDRSLLGSARLCRLASWPTRRSLSTDPIEVALGFEHVGGAR
jgi:hypothetical protein